MDSNESNLSIKDSVKKQKIKVASIKYFNSECYICAKPFGKGFLFHHVRYKEGEKTYRDFTKYLSYQMYILRKVRKDPSNFVLLCRGHHFLVEKMKRFNADKFERLVDVVKRSNESNVNVKNDNK